ncbi:iron-siderophore ABC transporter substrate-binding protein [Herbiconiux moechotypicola]|uniref:Iron-siderophore ABC transporter substrate-binding protein n=1 Tax=Herbiconiux moechotypicola TaxID=637393 RepID=A0ABP5QNF8_9MICO|nr:iron-siderophore ABC transporter substrate-binding protein [Herbiconiux moechotypicola]MCS5730587.1 iron-siderophore ABC transporter substrate-binding protein [Herbiconiux moechotypicola]
MTPFRLPARRALAPVALAAAAGLLLAGCARDERPTDTAGDGATYTVEHELGTTEIPVDYDRVAVTFTALADSAIAVGVVPVAAPKSFSGFPAYLGIDDSEVASLGDSDSEIDIELMGAQEPDLILMNMESGTAIEDTDYEQLSQVAPTVPIITGEQNPVKVAEQVAVALDRVEEMAEVAAAYETHATAVREALAEVPAAALPVSQVRLRPDHVRMMMEGTNAGVAMVDAGLVFEEPIAEVEDGGYYEISLELLPEATGDYVFVYSTDEGVLENVQTLPIWQEVPAVQNGTVFDVDFEAWMRGQGYLALNEVLDEIAAAYGVTAD